MLRAFIYSPEYPSSHVPSPDKNELADRAFKAAAAARLRGYGAEGPPAPAQPVPPPQEQDGVATNADFLAFSDTPWDSVATQVRTGSNRVTRSTPT